MKSSINASNCIWQNLSAALSWNRTKTHTHTHTGCGFHLSNQNKTKTTPRTTRTSQQISLFLAASPAHLSHQNFAHVLCPPHPPQHRPKSGSSQLSIAQNVFVYGHIWMMLKHRFVEAHDMQNWPGSTVFARRQPTDNDRARCERGDTDITKM